MGRWRSCPWCHSTVERVITERNGRPLDLDIGTDDSGNVVMVSTPAGRRARLFGRRVPANVEGARRMPHVATCPRDRDPYLTAQRRRRRGRQLPLFNRR